MVNFAMHMLPQFKKTNKKIYQVAPPSAVLVFQMLVPCPGSTSDTTVTAVSTTASPLLPWQSLRSNEETHQRLSNYNWGMGHKGEARAQRANHGSCRGDCPGSSWVVWNVCGKAKTSLRWPTALTYQPTCGPGLADSPEDSSHTRIIARTCANASQHSLRLSRLPSGVHTHTLSLSLYGLPR